MDNRPEPLRTKDDITRVLRRGARAHSPLFRLHHMKSRGPTRLAVIVGKSASKKATERNRIRRRAREAFARAAAEREQPLDAVLLPGKQVLRAPFDDMVEEMQKLIPQ